MTAAYFEDHPTDPDKVILRKPRLDQGPDYERGFIDGMMYQTQTTVNRAVDAMSKRTWVGLTDEEIKAFDTWHDNREEEVGWVNPSEIVAYIEAKLKEKNT
tara:strand:+ start:919 stop:1221 length:303 start_codon:yes stop_codon:yes gene_type:complete